MKLSLYEKIDRVCRLGKHAIVKNQADEYLIISPFKDILGNWRESICHESVKLSAHYIADEEGYYNGYWNDREKLGYKYIGVWTPPTYERFQVGDRVKINFKSGHFTSGVIKSIEDNSYIVDTTNYPYEVFSHDSLEPVFEDEEETVEVMGKKYKKSELEERLKELKEVEA